jgi:hypothetical protein
VAEKIGGSPKRAYNTPELKVYGDIETLTKAVSKNTPHSDGGTGLTDKTA